MLLVIPEIWLFGIQIQVWFFGEIFNYFYAEFWNLKKNQATIYKIKEYLKLIYVWIPRLIRKESF